MSKRQSAAAVEEPPTAERSDHGFPPSVVAAFNAKAKRTGGCWEWQGTPNGHGYGRASIGARHTMFAHRLSYLLFVGPLDDAACVLHHCDNRICVRPDHLFKGDRGDNARDMSAKGRAHLQRRPDAFAGDRHWKRQHPEKVKTKAVTCATCGRETHSWKDRARGRCRACDQYFQKHGIERPRALWEGSK